MLQLLVGIYIFKLFFLVNCRINRNFLYTTFDKKFIFSTEKIRILGPIGKTKKYLVLYYYFYITTIKSKGNKLQPASSKKVHRKKSVYDILRVQFKRKKLSIHFTENLKLI